MSSLGLTLIRARRDALARLIARWDAAQTPIERIAWSGDTAEAARDMLGDLTALCDEIQGLTAQQEGRITALRHCSDERAAEWKRAERAEAERGQLRAAILAHWAAWYAYDADPMHGGPPHDADRALWAMVGKAGAP